MSLAYSPLFSTLLTKEAIEEIPAHELVRNLHGSVMGGMLPLSGIPKEMLVLDDGEDGRETPNQPQ